MQTTIRAAVILPWHRRNGRGKKVHTEVSRACLEEAVGLASSIGLIVIKKAVISLRNIHSATLIGRGQLQILKDIVRGGDISVVIIEFRLSPVQQRNLEKELNCKVIDRTGLILDIFGERAVTREGSLQVELAHLEYQRSRLVRSWTHLERQRGGFGFMGGPGETQIESDKRIIGGRILWLKKELEQVRRTRGLHREARKKVPFPVAALVGYTNAGKSTLFNMLTGSSVPAADKLFVTLDPVMRAFILPLGRKIILSDTVGFISDLPTELVAAFRATLEEIADADIILHIRDIFHPCADAQYKDVITTLDAMAQSGTLKEEWRERVIEVQNKSDLLVDNKQGILRRDCVRISALKGDNIDILSSVIEAKLLAAMSLVSYTISRENSASVAWLYEHADIVERKDYDKVIELKVRLMPVEKVRFERYHQFQNVE